MLALTVCACAGTPADPGGSGGGPTPARLVLIRQPSLAQIGAVFLGQPAVRVQDSAGALVRIAGVSVSATIATGPAGATLGGTTFRATDADGRASFTDLRLDGPAGTYTLRFEAVGLAAAASAPLDVLPVNPLIPLTDLPPFTYFGYAGGLYPNANTMPVAHDSVGRARARAVVPRDLTGAPSPAGKYVLLSMGMSNTTQEWCAVVGDQCDAWTFTGQALAGGAVNSTSLVIVNGAMGGQTAATWDEPDDPNYDRVRDDVLGPAALSEAQVQVIWMKVANPRPADGPGAGPLPVPGSDADSLLMRMGNIVRAAKTRYPNLQIVFASSRTYAGYATIDLNPEPYAFESGFAVKWLIEAQIAQMASGTVDPRAGDLNYDTGAPWLAWAAYLWADGTAPRSDGLTWLVGDFEADGTHPSRSGETKVGALLLDFFTTSPHAACWFLADQTCP